jgi:DNA-binding NarL/FixJ family response regulator
MGAARRRAEAVGGSAGTERGHEWRVSLVETHEFVRALLEREIDAAAGMRVVHSCGSAVEARLRIVPGATDVLVVGVLLGDGNGIALASMLQGRDPGLRVLVLAEHDTVGLAWAAQRPESRLWSFVVKGSALASGGLVRTIRSTARGRPVVDPVVVGAWSPGEDAPLARLSSAQFAVLSLIAEGLSNEGVADALGLTPKGVEYHLGAIYKALGVRDAGRNARVSAVMVFLRAVGAWSPGSRGPLTVPQEREETP